MKFQLFESASLANADRKNAQRIMPERRKMDHKSDFILRRVGNGEMMNMESRRQGNYGLIIMNLNS